MKKKLLSVLMAGALVATSSVNAFASGTNTVTGKDTDVLQSDIEITGNIADTTGQVKPGTLSVTVPTAANFTVNENGEFIAGTIEISNGGEQEVDVHAYQFVDTNQEVGINVLNQSELAGKNRTHISLGIRGNYGTAYFKSAPGHNKCLNNGGNFIMKKKLLSVLMAGALVATSSVNAFATDTKVIDGLETQSHETNVEITGDIADKNGDVKPGTLNVTVPTAATFSVNDKNVFTGTSLKIVNNGEQEIEVFAYEFIDVNDTTGINVVKKESLTDQNRAHVSLKLAGNAGTAYFTTTKTNGAEEDRRVYSDEGCTQYGDATGIKVAKIAKNNSYDLRLEGEAGKDGEAVEQAIRDNFTLKLKIAKATTK